MGKSHTAVRIRRLLDAIRADFPRRKKQAEESFRQDGLDGSLELEIVPAEPIGSIPTFSNKVTRPVTPMLTARFAYASTIKYALDTWLSVREMALWMRKRDVRTYHRALRENWEGSAPMLFPDDQLTLLQVTDGVPDSLGYLVWRKEHTEPQVWTYLGFGSWKYQNLEEYLNAILTVD